MSHTATPVNLGTIGVFYVEGELTPEAAAEVERLGYTAVWIAGTREARLTIVERVLTATETLAVATGVVNIWHVEARAVADTYHRLEAAYPGRFLLGIGVGHRELGTDFRSPYQALVDYLDVLDERGVPKQRRVLAALGPRVLKLAAERSAGAFPFLVTPAYTRQARELIGPDSLLAVEHTVTLGDPTSTRAAGRAAIQVNLGLANYRVNLTRMGFGEDDLADRGSDALVDALVAQGDAATAAEQLRSQLNAGASHLVANAVPSADRLPILTALAPELGVAAR
ncbi:LLM class F420-dependent oxidoreductase [Pseudonocardia aurantiaca]|uniref:TIGR03620 family F420-dependent LLM class oxidoreductase n=1 Tax=Pseudonocardia aurantiaca TaxID=75290 RepID=A0ABW4FQS1_9PSEU